MGLDATMVLYYGTLKNGIEIYVLWYLYGTPRKPCTTIVQTFITVVPSGTFL